MSPQAPRMFGTRDMASCLRTLRVLQSYLDGQTDELTARRVANHLEACRRCGLEAVTYTEIKKAVSRRSPAIDGESFDRLRRFGTELTAEPPNEES